MLPESEGNVDYDRVRASKLPLLREAAWNFLGNASARSRARFERFCADNGWWLEDYALFVNLRDHYPGGAWNQWPRELARREPQALEKARAELKRAVEATRAIQFAFYEQWRALHQAARQRGIRIVGDVAIFVSYDSADVWTHPEIFRLNADLEPEVVAGVDRKSVV